MTFEQTLATNALLTLSTRQMAFLKSLFQVLAIKSFFTSCIWTIKKIFIFTDFESKLKSLQLNKKLIAQYQAHLVINESSLALVVETF